MTRLIAEIRARHQGCPTAREDRAYCTGCVLLAEVDALAARVRELEDAFNAAINDLENGQRNRIGEFEAVLASPQGSAS